MEHTYGGGEQIRAMSESKHCFWGRQSLIFPGVSLLTGGLPLSKISTGEHLNTFLSKTSNCHQDWIFSERPRLARLPTNPPTSNPLQDRECSFGKLGQTIHTNNHMLSLIPPWLWCCLSRWTATPNHTSEEHLQGKLLHNIPTFIKTHNRGTTQWEN